MEGQSFNKSGLNRMNPTKEQWHLSSILESGKGGGGGGVVDGGNRGSYGSVKVRRKF